MKYLAVPLLVAAGLVPAFAQRQEMTRPPDQSTTMQPQLMLGLPSMPVHTDDLISVTVYDAPELNRVVRVSEQGTIRLPLLKEMVTVENMMPGEMETAIGKELKKEAILTDPVVTISVIEYKSRPISVVGAVRNPTTFQALPGTTLLDAITRAAGLSEDAGPDVIVTRRKREADGKTTEVSQRISAKALVEGADATLNVKLVGGEEVRIPEAGKVFIVGQVRKPGAYIVRQDSDATVMKAIALSEGLDKYADKTAYVIRKEGPAGKQEIPVQLSKIMHRKAPDMQLQPNDVLYIPDSTRKRATLGSLTTIMALGTAGTTAAIYAAR